MTWGQLGALILKGRRFAAAAAAAALLGVVAIASTDPVRSARCSLFSFGGDADPVDVAMRGWRFVLLREPDHGGRLSLICCESGGCRGNIAHVAPR
jgi:hypothetical protein